MASRKNKRAKPVDALTAARREVAQYHGMIARYFDLFGGCPATIQNLTAVRKEAFRAMLGAKAEEVRAGEEAHA